MRILGIALTGAAALALAAPAGASVTINVDQVGSNVVATASGSINLAGLTNAGGNFGSDALVDANVAAIEVGGPLGTNFDHYTGLSGPGDFGSGGLFFASSVAGDPFAIVGSSGNLFVAQGYQSGSSINGTATFLNQTFLTLGLAPGVYTYTLPQDTVIVNIGTSGVPEPATWAMMLLGFGAIGLAMRRRKPAEALTA